MLIKTEIFTYFCLDDRLAQKSLEDVDFFAVSLHLRLVLVFVNFKVKSVLFEDSEWWLSGQLFKLSVNFTRTSGENLEFFTLNDEVVLCKLTQETFKQKTSFFNKNAIWISCYLPIQRVALRDIDTHISFLWDAGNVTSWPSCYQTFAQSVKLVETSLGLEPSLSILANNCILDDTSDLDWVSHREVHLSITQLFFNVMVVSLSSADLVYFF